MQARPLVEKIGVPQKLTWSSCRLESDGQNLSHIQVAEGEALPEDSEEDETADEVRAMAERSSSTLM